MKSIFNPSRKSLLTATIILSVLLSATVISQNRNPEKRRDKVQAFKIAFLTRMMDLTPEESQKFWPVYNEFEKKLQETENDAAYIRSMDPKKLAAMTDKEVEEALKTMMNNQQNVFNLRKKLHEDLKKVLPVRKVALFYIAERDFKKELVKMAIEKKDKRPK
jgi:hypothetical protein